VAKVWEGVDTEISCKHITHFVLATRGPVLDLDFTQLRADR